MENKKFWLGILAITLVFGMTVVGCDNGSTGNDDDDDHRPRLYFQNVEFDKKYPVVGETITANYRNSFNDAVGTASWTWYKTEEDATYLSHVTNKTFLGYGNTYTVLQKDVGFWIWAEVTYSGSRGTSTGTTSSTVIGIPATATVSVSMTAGYSSLIQKHYVTVKLILSEGRWNDIEGRWEGSNYIWPYNIASQWITMSGTPSVSSWYTGYETPLVCAEGRELVFYYNTNSNTILSINGLTTTLNTAQLSTMRSSTNVYNTLSAGTPTTVSVSQWTIYQY